MPLHNAGSDLLARERGPAHSATAGPPILLLSAAGRQDGAPHRSQRGTQRSTSARGWCEKWPTPKQEVPFPQRDSRALLLPEAPGSRAQPLGSRRPRPPLLGPLGPAGGASRVPARAESRRWGRRGEQAAPALPRLWPSASVGRPVAEEPRPAPLRASRRRGPARAAASRRRTHRCPLHRREEPSPHSAPKSGSNKMAPPHTSPHRAGATPSPLTFPPTDARASNRFPLGGGAYGLRCVTSGANCACVLGSGFTTHRRVASRTRAGGL